MKSRVTIGAVAAVVLIAGSVFACGPFFDDAYLVRGSEKEFLSMPSKATLHQLFSVIIIHPEICDPANRI